MTLHPYMVSSEDPSEGAFLAFDYSSQGAKVLAWRNCGELHELCDGNFTSARAKRLPAREDIMEQALHKLKPHVIVSPASCPNCEMWGGEPRFGGTLCEFCEDRDRGEVA